MMHLQQRLVNLIPMFLLQGHPGREGPPGEKGIQVGNCVSEACVLQCHNKILQYALYCNLLKLCTHSHYVQ